MIYYVYYQRFFGLLKPVEIKLNYLGFTHRLVRTVAANSLGDVFCQMQAESWSPNEEARSLIASLNLGHTSMSVGDVVRDLTGKVWVCNDVGWLPLRTEPIQPDHPPKTLPPPMWLTTEANFQATVPQITRLKITDERDCLPPDAYTVEPFGWTAFDDLVVLAQLIEQRLGLTVCIDLGEDFYETKDRNG